MNDEVMGSPEVPVQGSGSFVSRLVWTFSAPKKLYADIAADAPWWQPWVWVSILNVIIGWLSLPIQMQLVSMNPNDISEEQLEQTLDAMQKFGFLGLISTPVVVLITGLMIAGVSYLVISVLAERGGFKKYLTLYLYGSIISSVGLLLGTALTRLKGVESIRSIEDAAMSFGPAALLGSGHKILHPILASLDVFYIWFYVLVGAGVAYVFRMSRLSAFLVMVPVWLLFVLFSLIGSRLSTG